MVEELRASVGLAEALDLGDFVRGGLEKHGQVGLSRLLGLRGNNQELALGRKGLLDHLALGSHVPADFGAEAEEDGQGSGHDVIKGVDAGRKRFI